ncbi:hypothetical protein F4810DRAFT_705716 [Camillea tinctor]|nr:hypothetical protein F4810DRAFT_705716 [Camillea tinctor]
MTRANVIRPMRQALSRPLLIQQPRNTLARFAITRPESTLADKGSAPGEEKTKPLIVNEPDPTDHGFLRLPRAVQAVYLQPLRREAEYGVPSCDLQLRSFSIPNLEVFCDFALRAAYYLGLPAFGPVPLPKITERWTVPRSHFIFKKSQENFERITRRRLIQIRDGHPETVQIWLAYLQKHAYYGIGMKANVWQYSKIDTGKQMDDEIGSMKKIVEEKLNLLGRSKAAGSVEKLQEVLATYVRCRPLVATARQVVFSTPATIAGAAAVAARRSYSSTETSSAEEGTSNDNGSGSQQEGETKKETNKENGNGKQKENKVIFSGIQPTGIPHLGNYLGAMRQWKRIQDKAKEGDKLFWSIVDLHAITMPQDAESLRQRKRQMLAALIAIGLDPEKSHMFYQSSVPQHVELMWILSCTAPMGYLSRMTQWKSKLQANPQKVELDDTTVAKLKLGLFSYPVLQAADILVHRATHVPVGDDQRQHLEFSRQCVGSFNHAYNCEVLVRPKTITTPAPRVMSLTNPINKMSKSALNERSRVLITARETEIRSRLMGAITDMEPNVSWEPFARPGVANLLELIAQCRWRARSQDGVEDDDGDGEGGRETSSAAAEALGKGEFAGVSLRVLKEAAADAVVRELEGVRERFQEVLKRRDGAYLDEIEAVGAAEARKSAEETMRMVRRVVGLW